MSKSSHKLKIDKALNKVAHDTRTDRWKLIIAAGKSTHAVTIREVRTGRYLNIQKRSRIEK